jgi:hypothetical protein
MALESFEARSDLTAEEFAALAEASSVVGVPRAEISALVVLLNSVDEDRNGMLDVGEWAKFAQAYKGPASQKALQAAMVKLFSFEGSE